MEQEYAGAARSTDSRRGRLWDAAAITLLVVISPFFLKVLPGGRPPYGGDVFVHVYPLFSLIARGLHAGRPALWNPYAAGGYPIAPYGALAVYPPVVLALLLLPVAGAIASLYVAYLAVLGVGTYLLAGDLGQSRPARLLAAITMACGGFVAANVYAGHILELGAICPFPLAFLLLRRAIVRGSLPAALGCGGMLGLMILAAGLQFLPFALAPLLLLVIWHAGARLWRLARPERGDRDNGLSEGRRTEGDSRGGATPAVPGRAPRRRAGSGVRSPGAMLWALAWPVAVLALACAVGVALGAVLLLPFQEALGYSLRSGAVPYDAATTQSLPWGGLAMLVAPNAFGNAAANTYWPASRYGPYFHEIYAYAGLLPWLLMPVALWRKRASWPYGLLALLALGVMLGKHTPLYWLVYHLPGAALFRAPARAGLILDFALALLAGFGLDGLSPSSPQPPSPSRGEGGARRWVRDILIPGLLIVGATLVGLLVTAVVAGGVNVPLAARPLALAACARLAVAVVLGAGACLLVARVRSSRRAAVAVLAVPALALLDLATANGVLFRPGDPARYYQHTAATPAVAQGRVLALDGAVPLGACTVTRRCSDAQDAAPLALAGYWTLMHPALVRLSGGKVATSRDTITNPADVNALFLRLFGVRTVYSDAAQPPLRVTGLRQTGTVSGIHWTQPGGANWNVSPVLATSRVYRDDATLPHLFVVPRVISATPDRALAMLRANSVDPARVAVLSPGSGSGPSVLDGVRQAWAAWLGAAADNTVVAHVDAGAAGGALVVDDGWFPGWTATIDGHAAPVVRADYFLRAVRLPPGVHTVRLTYAPLSYLLGLAVTGLTALALIVVAVALAVRRPRVRVSPPMRGEQTEWAEDYAASGQPRGSVWGR